MKTKNQISQQQENWTLFDQHDIERLTSTQMLWIKGGGNDEDDYGDDSDDQDDGFN